MATLPVRQAQRIVRQIGARLKIDGYHRDFTPKYRLYLIAFAGRLWYFNTIDSFSGNGDAC